MITESTRELLDDNFIVRKLDRVQVVNVETPIRLYELLDYKSSETASLEKYVENWDKTMAIFEKGEYETALSYFKKMSEIKPDDNVAKYYISLLEKFFVKGKFPTAQDDFGVAYNDSNPENMKSEWLGTKYEIKGTFKLLQK